jgi:hypothetical protein
MGDKKRRLPPDGSNTAASRRGKRN